MGIVYNAMLASMQQFAIAPAMEIPGQEAVNANALDIQIKIIMNMTVAWTISTEIFKIAFDYVNQLNKIEFSKYLQGPPTQIDAFQTNIFS